jgi:hypothetical protein
MGRFEPLDEGARKTQIIGKICVRDLGGAVAATNGEIILPRRPFTDVHELVYLFQSWQIILEAEDVPEVLRPLQSMPEHLVPVMTAALAEAQEQLESAQAGMDITLRFRATPGFVELMQWGVIQLKEIETSLGDQGVNAMWQRALQLANELVEAALAQFDAVPVVD